MCCIEIDVDAHLYIDDSHSHVSCPPRVAQSSSQCLSLCSNPAQEVQGCFRYRHQALALTLIYVEQPPT